MSKITYPCETAAIFQDVIFVIRPQSKAELLSECGLAWSFFKAFFHDTTDKEIWDGVRYSFWGLYLDSAGINREAAA